MERLGVFHRFKRERSDPLPSVDIDTTPQDQEIVLFEQPLPNPFIAAWQIEDLRRQRQAENERE